MKQILIFLFILSGTILYAQKAKNNPIANFDKLWSEFDNRYANFELKSVDWDSIYKKYRPSINNQTTNDSLFTVCNKMICELKDGHVSLIQYGKKNKIIQQSDDGHNHTLIKKFPISKTAEPNIFQLSDLIITTLKTNGFSDFISIKSGINKYSTSEDYGYLLVHGMGGFKMGELKKFMDDAINAFKDKKGVIIDIRTNGGGADRIAHSISNRFTDKKRAVYLKRERKKGTKTYTPIETKYVNPTGNYQFTKPIVLLTSDFTASAADVFALIMKQLPYVTIIGDNTMGIFSDIYRFYLPNKWEVHLSNQQYFSIDMKNYEGIGIKPDLKLLNEPKDIINGSDPLILKAIEVLNQKTKTNTM